MLKNLTQDKNIEITIRDPKELAQLSKKRIFLKARPSRILFHLEILGPVSQVRSQYEKKLSKYYFECGCSWGTATVLFSLFIFIAAIIFGPLLEYGWLLIPAGMILIMVSAALGKTFGLLLARHDLSNTKKQIMDLLGYP